MQNTPEPAGGDIEDKKGRDGGCTGRGKVADIK